MPSTSQLTQNSRSMNGLNTINANAVFTDTLEVNTITIDTAGTVPTRPSGDSTLNIANTQFVSNAVATAGANYVDLTSTQTITGAKTFSNANTVVSGNLITNSIVSASATTDINIGTALTTGDINMGTTASGGQNVALNWGSGSNSGQLTFQGGSFTLGSSGNYNQYSGAIFDTNISTNQTSGVLNIATGGSKTGGINIGTGASAKTIVLGDGSLGTTVIRGQFAQLRPSQSGACNVGDNMTSGFVIIGRGDTTASSTTINIGNGTLFTGAINVGAGTSGNAPITIGSTASTTQTATHNAITTFSQIPSCAVAPTTANHLCNKTYVDSVAGGGGVSLAGTNVWTGTNSFNTNLPTSTQTPTTSTQLTTKTYVDSAITTGTTNLLAGTNAWTGTNSFNTNLPTSTQTPTTSTQLTTKTYVDSAITTGSSGLLASKNVWTNENDFTNIVKVQDPTIASYVGIDFFSSITPGIVMNGAPATTSALSGVNLNTNTLTVPIKNNQSLIRIRIPMNIAGFGVPSFYFGQLDIIFNSITAITILKNGSFYKTVSVFKLLNFTGTTKSWTGWSQKGENARAYVGDVQFELEITTANTSVDTYTIGITMDVAVNAGAVGLITPRFLCTGDVNFTTTHATTSTGTTYISTDPASYFPYQINYGNSGNYIIGKGDTYIKTIQGGYLTMDAVSQIDITSSGSNINVIAGGDGGVGDLNLKTLGTGSVNIQSEGNTSIQTNVAGGLISLKVSDGTTAIEIQDATASAEYQEAYIVIPETSRINIIPEGTILTSVVATAPEGYVLCNGASYSSTNVASNKYRRLFNAIGYTFGGSGASFNVPNFQGAFLRGSGSQTVGGVSYAGNAVGNNPQQDAVQTPLTASNQGFYNLASGTARQCPARAIITTDPVDTTTGILPRFARTATENRPFNFTVFYYIKF